MSARKTLLNALTLIVLTLTAVEVIAQHTSSKSKTTTIVSDSRSTFKYKSSSGVSDFNIELRGKMELNETDTDVVSMSDDGYLEINKTVFGSRRSIIIESRGQGKLNREYYEGRTKMEWEPNGRKWLAEILPDIVRNTTIGAESRVARFFKRGGTEAVLSEIQLIDSDHAKSIYANYLMKQPVPVKDYSRIVDVLADEVDSDHYLSEFLKDNIDKFMKNTEATAAFFAATRELDSDHYKTVVIKAALKDQIASTENVKVILQSASRMESDHYITEVLTTLLKQDNLNEGILTELIETTQSIESDHYKTVVLTRAMEKEGLSKASHERVLESIKDIESDHYLTQVVKGLLENKLTDQQLTLVLDLSESIDSDHYRSEVLRELLNRQDVTDSQFDKLVTSCGNMDSDHYKMTVLKDAMKASGATDKKVASLLAATADMDSDHYITEVLLAAAPKVKSGSNELRTAYRQAARNINSETYYGRALRAIE